jgi:hypothetical protein
VLAHYVGRMNLRCLFGRHQPMLTSIVKRSNGYTALCDGCTLPISRPENGRWMVTDALVSRRDQAA